MLKTLLNPTPKPAIIEMTRERGGGKVPFTEEQLRGSVAV